MSFYSHELCEFNFVSKIVFRNKNNLFFSLEKCLVAMGRATREWEHDDEKIELSWNGGKTETLW